MFSSFVPALPKIQFHYDGFCIGNHSIRLSNIPQNFSQQYQTMGVIFASMLPSISAYTHYLKNARQDSIFKLNINNNISYAKQMLSAISYRCHLLPADSTPGYEQHCSYLIKSFNDISVEQVTAQICSNQTLSAIPNTAMHSFIVKQSSLQCLLDIIERYDDINKPDIDNDIRIYAIILGSFLSLISLMAVGFIATNRLRDINVNDPEAQPLMDEVIEDNEFTQAPEEALHPDAVPSEPLDIVLPNDGFPPIKQQHQATLSANQHTFFSVSQQPSNLICNRSEQRARFCYG